MTDERMRWDPYTRQWEPESDLQRQVDRARGVGPDAARDRDVAIGRYNQVVADAAPEGTVWHTVDDEPRPNIPDHFTWSERVLGGLTCPQCLGLRFGPGHLLKRWAGACQPR